MTASEIVQIIEADENSNNFAWGVRSIPSRSENAVVGEVLPNSFVWVDGDFTDDELDGVCTIGIGTKYDDITVETVQVALDRAADYHQGRYVLVTGYSSMGGEDRGESIIREPIAIATW